MLEKEGAAESGHGVREGTFNGAAVRYVDRRVIVKLKPAEGAMDLGQAVDSVVSTVEGARLVRPPSGTGRVVLSIPAGEDVPTAATRLSGNPLVAYAEPDVVDRAQVVPGDPKYPDQWAPPVVNAEAAWDLETGDGNVVIGIIDSGISMIGGALDHPDLSTPGRITLGTDFVDDGDPRDLNGHGTHVAGIAAAAGNNGVGVAGMNWGSPLYVCRTLDANGNGSSADFADAVEEITDYAVANGLKAVINYSAGGGNNTAKQDAAQYASDNGMLLVAATGNDYGNPVIWPAAYSTTIPGVVAVGSTDVGDTVSNFSNVGPEVTVVAPGRNILSTTPTYFVDPTIALDYDTMNGTSMATPLVTGLAALMWSRHPGHTNQKIKDCLTDTAVKLGSGNFDNSWGYGRVDALAAVKCGDPIIVPTKITQCKTHLTSCPSRIVICSTRVGLCRTKLIVCKTHIVGCMTTHLASCKSRLIITCMPKTAICPTTRLAKCPSRLPVLCPTTKLSKCWSNLMCFEPVTKVATCGQVRTAICPSAVDACPSAPAGCGFDPGIVTGDPIRLRIRELELELEQLKQEMWYQAEAETEEGEGEWFYVDDDGEIHEA